jgi:hypothetical protein
MTLQRHLRAFVLVGLLLVSLLAAASSAQAADGDIQIKQFFVEPLDSTDPPGTPPAVMKDPPTNPPGIAPSQAGWHPDMRILFRLCDPEGGDPVTTRKGCSRDHLFTSLKHFTLHLPPGMLGNPTQIPICPTHLFYAASCPPESQVGFSLTDGVQGENPSPDAPLLDVATPLFNVQTIGLEPARLGTGAPLPTDPPGPLPIIVTLRTENAGGREADFGIDSTINEVPFKLGAFAAKAAQFDTLLCSDAPCTGGNTPPPKRYVWVKPRPGATPFFRNPTSCKPATMRMDAISYQTPQNTVHAQSDLRQQRISPTQVDSTQTEGFSPTGCDQVPFDLDVTTTPDTTQAGAPTGMTVELKYPDYANAPIWQSQLKDADVTLPEGVVLGPAGGTGLEQCTEAQFGQGSNDPVKCPPGSQIGTIEVTSPALPTAITGRAFFGPVAGPGQPTASNPWKLFLLLEGHGLRIKLPPGEVTVADNGQIRTVFKNNPEVPFTTFKLKTRGGPTAILTNPRDCGEHLGEALLSGHSGAERTVHPSVDITGCQDPKPFQPAVEDASAIPKEGGANSVSHLLITRPDGHQMLKGLTLALPPGAVGNIANAPLCPAAVVSALESNPGLNCPASSKVGNIRTTVGSGDALLSAPGNIYIGEAVHAGDAASFVIVIPAKVGPIDLGRVVLVNRAQLRPSDTGVNVVSPPIPTSLGGIPLPVRKIEITVDKENFFLNPTGCDTRNFTATFSSDEGASATSSFAAAAEDCGALPFSPKLEMIAGADGATNEGVHPPLKAIVTQGPGEANIANARVVVPDILRPNVPFFQKPGALCTDDELARRACPALSQVGTASVITPVLPFKLSGPVYIVLPKGSPLPNLAVLLRGNGIEVTLSAKNGFSGIKILNTFDGLPDVAQARFELNIKGGPNGILNAFSDLCTTKPLPIVDARFTGQNGKTSSSKDRIETDGCIAASARVSLSGRALKVRKGAVGVRITCPKQKFTCRGRLTIPTAGGVKTSAKRKKVVMGSRRFAVKPGRTQTAKVRITKAGKKVVKRYKRLRVRLTAKLDGARTTRRTVKLSR